MLGGGLDNGPGTRRPAALADNMAYFSYKSPTADRPEPIRSEQEAPKQQLGVAFVINPARYIRGSWCPSMERPTAYWLSHSRHAEGGPVYNFYRVPQKVGQLGRARLLPACIHNSIPSANQFLISITTCICRLFCLGHSSPSHSMSNSCRPHPPCPSRSTRRCIPCVLP